VLKDLKTMLYLMPSIRNGLKRLSTKEKFVILAVILGVSVLLISEFWVIPEIFHKPSLAVTPVIGPFPPAAGYYLPYRGNISRIFVVSTSISSGFYPYPTRRAIGQTSGPPVVEKGEPCVIINVTIRNDYSAQNPPTPQNPDPAEPTLVYVYLTAKIFSGNNEINATDLTNVGQPPDSLSSAWLNGGETATISIYLATTSKTEITSFQIDPAWIGGITLA
jgi:hypothetical protein